MNKLLALLNKNTPYIPLLKTLCGSISAAILMQQLEYRFANYENGFYKFLNPCSHHLYKASDSWCEELNFSINEFRASFDSIGIRYRSINAVIEYINVGNDIDLFQGKMYCSVYDVKQGLTYYFRNHKLIDAVIHKISENYQPKVPIINQKWLQPVELFGSMKFTLPEVRKTHFQIYEFLSSRSANCTLHLLYNEAKNTTEKTAAEGADQELSLPDNNTVPIAAAAFEKNDENKSSGIEKSSETSDANSQQQQASKKPIQAESLLGDELTPAQYAWVCKALTSFEKFHAKDLSVLIDEVTTVLLDSDSFKKTGRDFHHKLNAITKEIKAGRWQTPAKLLLAEERQSAAIVEQQQRERQALQDDIKGYEQERRHWQKMLTYKIKETDKANFQTIINRCDLAIAELQRKLNMKEGSHTC